MTTRTNWCRTETWEKEHGKGFSSRAVFSVFVSDDSTEYVEIDPQALAAVLKEAGYTWMNTNS